MTAYTPSRRRFLRSASALPLLASIPGLSGAVTANTGARPASVDSTVLRWLDGAAPARFEGCTLGVPWPRGALRLPPNKRLDFTLGANGPAMQSWPLAWWPDGSLKWTAHAVAGGATGDGWNLGHGTPPRGTVAVQESAEGVLVTAGELTWTIPSAGEVLVRSVSRAGRVTMQNLKLVALRQDGPQLETGGSVSRQRFTSKLTGMTVEQAGPVRAVVKLDGVHSNGKRDWLPFSVRLYFYTGSDSVRIVHSFIYDGEPAKDFIAGLGVTPQMPTPSPEKRTCRS